jgi:hypothetical protein
LGIVFFNFLALCGICRGRFCAIVFGGALLAEEAVDASDGLEEALAVDLPAVGPGEGDEDAPRLGMEQEGGDDPLHLTRGSARPKGIEVAFGGASAGSFSSSWHGSVSVLVGLVQYPSLKAGACFCARSRPSDYE